MFKCKKLLSLGLCTVMLAQYGVSTGSYVKAMKPIASTPASSDQPPQLDEAVIDFIQQNIAQIASGYIDSVQDEMSTAFDNGVLFTEEERTNVQELVEKDINEFLNDVRNSNLLRIFSTSYVLQMIENYLIEQKLFNLINLFGGFICKVWNKAKPEITNMTRSMERLTLKNLAKKKKTRISAL